LILLRKIHIYCFYKYGLIIIFSLGSDYVDISAGCYHSLALKSDGSLVGWGHNNYGQIDNLPIGNNFVEILGAEYGRMRISPYGIY
jgi:hypothetical protein